MEEPERSAIQVELAFVLLTKGISKQESAGILQDLVNKMNKQ